MKIPDNCEGCHKPLEYPDVMITVDIAPERRIVVYCDACEYALCTHHLNIVNRPYNCSYCGETDINNLWPCKLGRQLELTCNNCLGNPIKTKISKECCLNVCYRCQVLKSIEDMHCYLVGNNKWICNECNLGCECLNYKNIMSVYSGWPHVDRLCTFCLTFGCVDCLYYFDRTVAVHHKCLESIYTWWCVMCIKKKEVPIELKKMILEYTDIPLHIILRYFHEEE